MTFGEFFNPGLKHLREERERKRHELIVTGDAAPPWDIDRDGLEITIAATPRPSQPPTLDDDVPSTPDPVTSSAPSPKDTPDQAD
jgi:hypothetical protein